MGHRCNYVVREDGELTLYYSHWGALGVPRDFFWGLAAARAFLAGHEPCGEDRWLDDVYGEGGAALDLDTKTLTIDGGEIYGPARDLLFELMAVVWARDGFRLVAADSFIQIATAVGLPASTVEAAHCSEDPIDVTKPGAVGRDDGYLRTLVVLDGEPRFAGRSGDSVAELGVERLGELTQLPDLAEAKHLLATKPPVSWDTDPPTLVRRLSDSIVIDTRAKRLELSPYRLQRSTSRAHFAAKWPGYELVVSDLGDILARLAHPDLALPPPPPAPTFDEQLAEIEQYLFGARCDMAKWLAERPTEPGTWTNPLALVSTGDGRPADVHEANALFRTVVAEVRAERFRASTP